MGRHAVVTYEQIATAAEQLQADGLAPAAKLIRTKLGSVGSLATIQKHLVEWRSKQGGTQSVTRILPSEFQRAVFKFLDAEVARINGELRQQVEQAERDTADIAADNEQLTALVSQLRAELADQASLKDKQDGQICRLLDELEAAHAETENERCEAELARHTLTKIQASLEAQGLLERDLRQLRSERDAEREKRFLAEREAAVLKAQKDGLEARIREMKEAMSTRANIEAAPDNEHAGNQPEHSPQTSGHPGKNARGSGQPITAPPGLDSGSVSSFVSEQSG
jgi:DNA repair exonuclease SbcCD ATPase subunit